MRRNLLILITILLICVTFSLATLAENSIDQTYQVSNEDLSFEYRNNAKGKTAEEIIKEVVSYFDRIKDFKGALVSKVFLEKKEVTYQTNLMKNQQRSLTDNSYTFGKVQGTEEGRLLNALPWIYLPPDYSLLQNGLLLSGQRDYLEPLANLEDLYKLKLLGEAKLHNRSIYLLELSNVFSKQVLWIDKEKMLINRIEIFNGANQLVATINYNGYRELVEDVWLPNLIVVEDNNGKKLLEINYQNWVVNSGLNNSDFSIGFAYQARQEIDKLKKIIDKNHKDTESRYKLAKLYYQVLETDKAINTLLDAIKIKKKIKYYKKLAEIYREQGKYKESIDMVNEALILDYQNSELHFMLGELNLQLQQISKARNSLERAVSLEPTNEQYLERLFWTYRRSSFTETMLRNAQNTLNKLIKLNPNKPEYQIYSGNLYLESKKYNKAAHRYQKAIQVAPKDIWGYIKLAECYEAIGKHRLAEELYKVTIRIDKSWLNYEKIADFYYRWQDYKKAIQNYNIALKLKSEQFALKVKLGKSYWEVGKKDKALEIWGRILETKSLKLNDYIKLGSLFTKYNLDNLAVATYQQGIQEFSNSIDSWTKKLVAELHAKLAKLYKEQDNYELAMDEYNQALKLYQYSWVYRDLGVLKLKNGKLGEAIELWQKAKEKNAGNLEVVYNLAIAHIITEEFDKAEADIEYIKRFNPDQKLSSLVNKASRVINELQRIKAEENNSEVYGQKYKIQGDQLRQKGKLKSAVEMYQMALEKNSYYGDAYFNLGLIQSVMQNYQEVKNIINNFDNDYFQQNKADILKEMKALCEGVN